MNKLSTLLVLALVAFVAMADDEFPTFSDYRAKQSLKFSNPAEEAFRGVVYNANLRSIKEHNANPKRSYNQGVNRFTHYTKAEYVVLFLGNRDLGSLVPLSVSSPTVGAWAPTAVDWRNVTGVVSPIKDQGSCGGCFAFSAVAALESLRFQAYGISADFSEQQIVSCQKAYGCSGGLIGNALRYVQTYGIATEANYPYTSGGGMSGTCKTIQSNWTLFTISGVWDKTTMNTCADLAKNVTLRPVSVAVDGTNWSPYKNGTFNNCNNTKTNHAVLLVGVNSNEWIIKNSYGVGWGESGFIRLIATNGNNTCNVCKSISYPIK
jgi:C1A family cysteine protease